MAEEQKNPEGQQRQPDNRREEQTGDWKATGSGSSESTSRNATGNPETEPAGWVSSVPESQEAARIGAGGDNELNKDQISAKTGQNTGWGQQAAAAQKHTESTGDIEDSKVELRNSKEDTSI